LQLLPGQQVSALLVHVIQGPHDSSMEILKTQRPVTHRLIGLRVSTSAVPCALGICKDSCVALGQYHQTPCSLLQSRKAKAHLVVTGPPQLAQSTQFTQSRACI
jgi:hypothetical protein